MNDMEETMEEINLLGHSPALMYDDIGQSNNADDFDEFLVLNNSIQQSVSTYNLLIYGTKISLTQYRHRFEEFIKTYTKPGETEIFYITQLERQHKNYEILYDIDCNDMLQFNSELYHVLVKHPANILTVMESCISEIYDKLWPGITSTKTLEVRPVNCTNEKTIRGLNLEDVNTLVVIKGLVTKIGQLVPQLQRAYFRCTSCKSYDLVDVINGYVKEISNCCNCTSTKSYELVHQLSTFVDEQVIKIQEMSDDNFGLIPVYINAVCYNSCSNKVRPGDNIIMTSIYKIKPVRLTPNCSNVYTVFDFYLEPVYLQNVCNIEDNRVTKVFTQTNIEKFKQMAKQENIYNLLATNLAPAIAGNLNVKKGILLQLLGGTLRKSYENNNDRQCTRSQIHILMCGDPGTSKSQLLTNVYNHNLGSQYVCGYNATAAGLTVSVVKDNNCEGFILQSGALVYANNNVCCIDELDKMDDKTRNILHEVMEHQCISVAKAGIICQLNANTSVLASANPCDSNWTKEKTIAENLKLPYSLLSRFDLIFLMLDPHNEEYDKYISKHIVELYHSDYKSTKEAINIVYDYIIYAKENYHPKLSQAAVRSLNNMYVKMRKINLSKCFFNVHPRQLESLIRLSEAHAKMRLSNVVEIQDTREAYRLFTVGMNTAAVNECTGLLDFSKLAI